MGRPSRVRVTGPLAPHAAGFRQELARQGYTPNAASNQLQLMAHASRWLESIGLGTAELSPVRVEEFLAHRRTGGYRLWLSARAMVPMLGYLRALGVVPTPAPVAPATEAEWLQEHYRVYLVQEHGLAPTTIVSYLHVARLFLAARAAVDGALHLERLSAAEVTEYVLVECVPRSVGSAKYVVCGLRSLLRYLYVAGHSEAQLAAAVPKVAGWRLAGLPTTFGRAGDRDAARRCLPPRGGPGPASCQPVDHGHLREGRPSSIGRSGFGAVVRFGGEQLDEGAARGPRQFELALGGTTITLEPVRVRVDRSIRWQWDGPGAEQFGDVEPANGPADEPPPFELLRLAGDGDAPAGCDGDGGDEGAEAHESAGTPGGVNAPADRAAQPADGRDAAAPIAPAAQAGGVTEPAAAAEVDPPTEAPIAAEVSAGARDADVEPPARSAVSGARQGALLPEEEASDDGAGTSVVVVRCLGPLEVEAGGRPVTTWPGSTKARELLALLALRGGATVSREAIITALWPGEEQGGTRQQLHNATHYLRRTLREATGDADGRFIVPGAQGYGLEPGRFRVDLDRFDAHVRRALRCGTEEALGECEQALAQYRGELLAGEAYEWLDPHLRDCARRVQVVAHTAGEKALEIRDWERAKRLYDFALARDPTDERAARGLMRAHAGEHDPNGARKVYRALLEALRRELDDAGIEPAPETTALLDAIVAGAG